MWDVHQQYEFNTHLRNTLNFVDDMNFLRCPRLISKVTWNPHSAYRTSLRISSHICLSANSSGTTCSQMACLWNMCILDPFLSENPASLFICEFVIFNLQYLTLLRNIYICLLFLILNPVCPKSGPPLIGRPPLFLHHPSLQLVLIPRENSHMSFLDHTFYIWDIHFKNISSIIKCEDSKESVQYNFTDFIPPNLQSHVWENFVRKGWYPPHLQLFFFTK